MEEMKQKFLLHPNISVLSVGDQSEMLRAFTEVLESAVEVNPYATLAELSISTA